MSEFSTPEQRTELPTDRRMGQLRKEGQIHLSYEVVQVLSLIAGFWCLQHISGNLISDFQIILIKTFSLIAEHQQLTPEFLRTGFLGIVYLVGPEVLGLMVVVAAVASLAVMLQTKWNVKEKKIKFRFELLNPLEGIKRIFSIMGLVNTGKAILKLALIMPIGYYALKRFAPQMVALMHTSIQQILAYTGDAMMYIFWKIAAILILMAIFDYFWSRFQWFKQNKMTKEEVKDEKKSIEGDEETRRKIQWKGLQRIMKRLKQSVRKADVVITNPTHYAVALQYDRNKMDAPIVVAKGRGFMALRIREMAKELKIPVVERKTLARALFASVEEGAQIPYELFKAVAEVLAYVYRIKTPYRYQTQPSG